MDVPVIQQDGDDFSQDCRTSSFGILPKVGTSPTKTSGDWDNQEFSNRWRLSQQTWGHFMTPSKRHRVWVNAQIPWWVRIKGQEPILTSCAILVRLW